MGNCMAVCARAPRAPSNNIEISNEEEAIKKELNQLEETGGVSGVVPDKDENKQNEEEMDASKDGAKSARSDKSRKAIEDSHDEEQVELHGSGSGAGQQVTSKGAKPLPLAERNLEDEQNRTKQKRSMTSSAKRENNSIKASKDKKEGTAAFVLRAKNEKDNELIKTTFGQQPVVLDKIELDNGITYEGAWLNGMRHGHGTQIWVDGTKYVGEWKHNEANGQGKLCHSDGDVYEGSWVNDKANGKGVYTHSNGAKYTGEWLDDKQHGKGVEEWLDGAKYEGQYQNGAKNGKGLLKFLDGSYYEGEFMDNEIHGFGIYLWSENRKYEGEWAHNKMHGKGKIIWNDGRKYEGDYDNDKKHGFGVFEWADGRKYIGNWENGKQHGRGEYISAKGQRKVGEWVDGKRIKWMEDVGDQSNRS